MRAPTTLPPVLRSTMRPPTAEYCDFLRSLKSRGCYHSNYHSRYIVEPWLLFVSRKGRSMKSQTCSATTSHGCHLRQIETDRCIRLTLCVATSSSPLDSPPCHVYVPSLSLTISPDLSRREVNDRPQDLHIDMNVVSISKNRSWYCDIIAIIESKSSL